MRKFLVTMSTVLLSISASAFRSQASSWTSDIDRSNSRNEFSMTFTTSGPASEKNVDFAIVIDHVGDECKALGVVGGFLNENGTDIDTHSSKSDYIPDYVKSLVKIEDGSILVAPKRVLRSGQSSAFMFMLGFQDVKEWGSWAPWNLFGSAQYNTQCKLQRACNISGHYVIDNEIGKTTMLSVGAETDGYGLRPREWIIKFNAK